MNSYGFSPNVEARFFSLGRHALVAGLKASGIGRGKTILLPEYICRDLLAAIHAVGATVAYYPVSQALEPALGQEQWPNADAVLAVNYFGFPQPLKEFRQYCQRTGAVLIEDNAHGYLSRDETGQLLGFRGDLGILSMRKTFALPNGAALVVPHVEISARLGPQIPFQGTGGRRGLRIKTMLRRLPGIGPIFTAGATKVARKYRELSTGHAILPSGADAESQLPQAAAAYSSLLHDLKRLNFEEEVVRRRALYVEFAEKLQNFGLSLVFKNLPNGVSPYGLIFRAEDYVAQKIQKIAEQRGLDAFRWPDLPDAITQQNYPEHYRKTWVLNFLW